VLEHLNVKNVHVNQPPLIGRKDYVSLTFNPCISDEKIIEFSQTMVALMVTEGWTNMPHFVSSDYAKKSENCSSRSIATVYKTDGVGMYSRASFLTLYELDWAKSYTLIVVDTLKL
jgi:hypothetical protein